MATQDLVNYYANLLILQYLGKTKAYATIQTLVAPVLMPQTSVEAVSFPSAPASGTFQFTYGAQTSAAINWNDPAGTIQTKLQALTGLGSIAVTGSIASLVLTVTFNGVIPPALLLGVTNNTLQNGSSQPVVPSIVETDTTLPITLQNAFNLIGSNPAQGVQLDTLGKYAGVTRSGYGFHGVPITLNDADFITLIQMAIIKNSAGSSLATIQSLLAQFFPNEVLVFDYQNMQMSYLISSSIGSQNLVQLFVSEGLLPKPMAVSLAPPIYAPVITMFFGFRTYVLAAFNSEPFNKYSSYQTNWPWLTYANAVVV
jgi:hypothetical protein